MGLPVIAEGLVRLEHKVDAMLRHLKITPTTHFYGLACPACSQQVDYQIDFGHGVVARKCGCKTGKQAPMPLLPMTQGAPDVSTSSPGNSSTTAGTPQSPRSKGR